jgi:hypothetical protein
MAHSYNNLAHSLSRCEPPDRVEAEKAQRACVQLWRQLASDFSSVPEYHGQLGNALNTLGFLLKATDDRLAESRDVLAEGLRHERVALEAYPNSPTYRRNMRFLLGNLANASLRLGDAAAAAQAADQLAPFDENGGTAYEAARTLVEAAAQAGQRRSSDRADPAAAEGYVRRAVALLRESAKKGYATAKRLEDDRAFEALRARADYQQLLKELGGGTGPG